MSYAEHTQVPVERTRAEIEKVLRAYGADAFTSGWEAERVAIQFRAQGRFVRFEIKLPKRDEPQFTHVDKWRRRAETAAQKLYDQAVRQRWRALLLSIKAKLESVQAGISTFEEEFLARIVLPDQTLVGDRVRDAIASAYETGKMPALMAHEP